MNRLSFSLRILAVVAALSLTSSSIAIAKGPAGFSSSGSHSSSFHAASPASKPAEKVTSPSGFSSTSVSHSAAPAPKGVLDKAAGAAVSDRALKDYDAKKAASQTPPVPPMPSSAPSAESAPIPSSAPPTVTQRIYIDRTDNSGFMNGMMVQSILQSLERSHDRAEIDRLRNQLYQARATSTDPALASQIQAGLDKSDPGPNPFAARTPVPAADPNTLSQKKSSSSNAFLWAIVLIIIAGGAGYYLYRRSHAGDSASATREGAPVRPAPRDETLFNATNAKFRPGGRVLIKPTPFILLSALDTAVPDCSGAKSIASVGRFSIGNVAIERAYLSDGKTFLERAIDTEGGAARQIGVYALTFETFPSTIEDWEGFIGSETENGIIGDVNITVPPADKSYDRIWGDGDNHVDPLNISEKITDASGDQQSHEHEIMAYARNLGEETADQKTERLYFGKLTEKGRARIQVWTGVELSDADIEVS